MPTHGEVIEIEHLILSCTSYVDKQTTVILKEERDRLSDYYWWILA